MRRIKNTELVPKTHALDGEAKYFTEALATKNAFNPGLDSGLPAQKLIEGAYKSAKPGRKVVL